MFLPLRVQKTTSGTKESDFANQQNFCAAVIRQARGWERRLGETVRAVHKSGVIEKERVSFLKVLAPFLF